MSVTVRTDVTAVKFYEKLILAGIGSSANILERESTRLLHRIQCLNGQKIYGFIPSGCNKKILVFGGNQWTILNVNIPSENNDASVWTRLFDPIICEDWLLSAVWINENEVALLTSHNVVQKWNILKPAMLSKHASKHNSILYSGLLVLLQDGILVLAGTVFSEVIIQLSGDSEALQHLKGHRGVIFSISCAPEKEIIITTSDDRSVRIWQVNNTKTQAYNTREYWNNADVTCKHELYGHTARVMRSCITNFVVSVGEDSAICFWDLEGKLSRKITSHQNGCIWSVDASNDNLVTGGGDSAVILHPLTVASEYSHVEVLSIDLETPKKVVFTARKNLVVMNDKDVLTYYNMQTNNTTSYVLKHESTYKLLSLSSCKQLIAIADMSGKLDVFIENCKEEANINNIIDTKLQIRKILSMQWAGNRHLVFCSENGVITVLASNDSKTEVFAIFTLPSCKERWLTASAVDARNKFFIFGDRCGNLHVYIKGQTNPIKSFHKIHGRYGPTSITIRNNEVTTTGRDGTLKTFSLNTELPKYIKNKELEFQWVEKFLDKDGNIVCGFQERVFMVYDLRNSSKLLEVPCGGGHRSWDAIRFIEKVNNEYKTCIKLVYLKNSDINLCTFEMNKIVSKNVINGSHSKEINCLKAYKTDLDKSKTFYISGGEDTTLRVSSINTHLQFRDEIVCKQLSNVRTLNTVHLENNKILLISAGGRAQICVKIVTNEIVNDEINVSVEEVADYLVKGTDKERKGNQTWRNCSVDFDPETRIMDIDIIKTNINEFLIFAGCSDSLIRVFQLKMDHRNAIFKPVKELKHHETCVLKTHCLKYQERDVLVSCSTRGEVTLWAVTYDVSTWNVQPILTFKANKSGINSLSTKILSNNSMLIATGGDDNSLHLTVLTTSGCNNLESFKVSNAYTTDKLHSSQITGLVLLDDIVISTSIDQRITVCKWDVSVGIKCEFLSQTFSDVADIQGIDLLHDTSESVTVCVYGKGMEVVKIARTH